MTTSRKAKVASTTWEQICAWAEVPIGTMAPLEMVQMLCDHHGHPISLADVQRAYGRWAWSRD